MTPTGVLKVSKPGVDVLTASNLNLQFSSEYAHLKTLISGTMAVGVGATGSAWFGISLGRPPICEVFVHYRGVSGWTNLWSSTYAWPQGFTSLDASASIRLYHDVLQVQNNFHNNIVDVDYRIWEYPI